MTKQELNRDIKRLLKSVLNLENSRNEEYDKGFESKYDERKNAIEKEFLRLLRADKEFEYMNKNSILIMLRINLRYRFEPLHYFGLFIDLPGLSN